MEWVGTQHTGFKSWGIHEEYSFLVQQNST